MECEYVCDNCECKILDERDLYEIEYYNIYWCEECMFNYMDGPTDDLLEDLADDLQKL